MKSFDNNLAKSRTVSSSQKAGAAASRGQAYEAPEVISSNAVSEADKAKLANACTSLNTIT